MICTIYNKTALLVFIGRTDPSRAAPASRPGSYLGDQKIKSEPRDKTPPHPASSPLRVFSPNYEQEPMQQEHYQQAWGLQGGLNITGPSHMSYGQEVQWGQNYVQLGADLQPLSPNMHSMAGNMPQMTNLQPLSPNMHRLSPNMQAMSPNMQAMSPNMQAMSPNMQAMSPNMQAMSPGMQALSPNMQALSPNMQAMSPNMQSMSPNMQAMSPNMQSMSPNMQAMNPGMQGMSPNMQGMPPSMQAMGSQSSLPMGLGPLLEAPLGEPLTSSELSGLAALLDRGNDLSDSLNRLSTGDLYPICSGD